MIHAGIEMDDLLKIRDWLSKELSFDFSSYDEKFLDRVVAKRMSLKQIDTKENYYTLLTTEPLEKNALINDLAINVTHFMRDKSVFDFFKTDVMPKILEKKRITDRIDIWSAGCASGEEPYSIAMMVFEALGRKITNYRIKIVASDLSDFAIERAKVGIYEQQQLKEMDELLISKYFFKTSDGKFTVKQHIRDLVEFKKINLLKDNAPCKFDAVFCRNTVIYFSKEGKESLYVRFVECLNECGFFIMGKTETLSGIAMTYLESVSTSERVYRKIQKNHEEYALHN